VSDFEFQIDGVFPIGLAGEGQRALHTNVVGRIVKGSVRVGDLVCVPWKGGGEGRVAIKGLMAEIGASRLFPEALTASSNGSQVCCLSLSLPPHESNRIDSERVVRSSGVE